MTSALSLSPAKPEGPSPSMSPLGGVMRWIRKKQVAEMTAVLENSAVYANILKKEAEERAAESA